MMRAGRMLAQGDLRLLALALIAEQPRHGYEIIKVLEEKTEGWYAPSPGIVYPTLTYLEEAGYVTAQADGAKRLYTITDEGRAYLESNRDFVDAVLERLDAVGERMRSRSAATRATTDGTAADAAAGSRRARESARRRGRAAQGRRRRRGQGGRGAGARGGGAEEDVTCKSRSLKDDTNDSQSCDFMRFASGGAITPACVSSRNSATSSLRISGCPGRASRRSHGG